VTKAVLNLVRHLSTQNSIEQKHSVMDDQISGHEIPLSLAQH
jgi:hypothetical protein